MLHHIHIGDRLIADPAGVPDGGIGIDLAAAYNAAARPPGLIQITWTNQGGLYFNTPSNWSDDQTPENVDSGTITLAKAETIYSIGSRIGALMTNPLVTLAIPDYGPDNSFTIGTDSAQSSTFSNGGTVLLEAKADTAELIIASPTLTLSGGGLIEMFNDGSNNEIIAATAGDTLQNVNNTIEGGGYLGDGTLALINSGIIDANSFYALQLNTGSTGENLAGGELLATGSGGLQIQNGAYTNLGLIEAENGSAVSFQNGATLTNSANGTLKGGTYEAAASGNGATISVTGGAISVDAAYILLSGAGASIDFGGTALDNSLSTIAAAGTLSVLNGRAFTANANGGAFTDDGSLVLSGGSFAASTLTIAGGGVLGGSGTVAGAVVDSGTIFTYGTLSFLGAVSGGGSVTISDGSTAEFAAGATIDGKVSNSGTIDATGGGVTIAKSVGGTGTMDIGASGTLSLLDGAASGQVVDFLAATGLLELASPTRFNGAISGFGGSDTIDLVNTTETSYHYADGELTLKDDGKRVAALHFDGSYTKTNFSLTSDLHGGTLIEFQK